MLINYIKCIQPSGECSTHPFDDSTQTTWCSNRACTRCIFGIWSTSEIIVKFTRIEPDEDTSISMPS